nr:phosphoribosylanthranilate isomerase [Desulfurispira natronophila]
MCGIRDLDTALQAVQCGASALGFVHHPPSPRYISPQQTCELVQQLPPLVETVSLAVKISPSQAVEMAIAAQTTTIQYYGTVDDFLQLQESFPRAIFATWDEHQAQQLWRESPHAWVLFEGQTVHHGGAGVKADWGIARKLAAQYPIILAGGLQPENVAEAVRAVRPHGVDVSSGIESERGIKCPQRMEDFVKAAMRGL